MQYSESIFVVMSIGKDNKFEIKSMDFVLHFFYHQ